MQIIDTLLSAKWVIPIIPRDTVWSNYSVAISQGRIIDVLETTIAKKLYQAQEEVILNNHVLLPGLINGHTHATMTLLRGLANDLPLFELLQKHSWLAEADIINSETVTLGTQLAIAEMIRSGTTCYNDMYFFPLAAAQAMIDIGMRGCQGLIVGNVPTNWAKTETEYLQKARAAYLNRPASDLLTWAITPHSTYVNSDFSLRAIHDLAREFNLRVHSHAHESVEEIAMDVAKTGKRSLQRLDEAGLLDLPIVLAHMVQLTDEEVELVSRKQVNIIHCPESNMKLGHGFLNPQLFTATDINLALGTDGAMSNNDLNMFGEMKSAAFAAKGSTHNPKVFPAYQLLEMATFAGAKALGLDQIIGSLEKGKAADLVAVDLSHYFTQPVYHVVSLLVYALDRMQVSDVWINGKRLLQQGELTTLDIKKVLADIKPWEKRIQKYD